MENDKITMEEHNEMGRMAKLFRNKLIRARHEYKGNKQIYGSIESKALKFLDGFRDQAEEVMFKDHPKQATTHIYYGER